MSLTRPISALGGGVLARIAGIGAFTRFFFQLLGRSGIAVSRPRLVSQQIHFIGNYSLLIIAVSGMFVGFVLGLQGYYTLNRYGAEESLGLLVALSLVRELGPVVCALLFAGRAGTSLTAEIGLMKATDQLSGMEMMDSADDTSNWGREHIDAAIKGIAEVHSIWYGRENELKQQRWLVDYPTATGMQEKQRLWELLGRMPGRNSPSGSARMT